MTAVMGIDAAWTPTAPSGVALVENNGTHWRCVALSPSYSGFYEIARGQKINWMVAHPGEHPRPDHLLEATKEMADGGPIDVVAVDMPLSRRPITGRRRADDELSRAYGGRGCGAHTPSLTKPGPISEATRDGFASYPLATATTGLGTTPALLEVYPHPALLTLTGATYRLPYKVARSTRYWKGAPLRERKERLLEQYNSILSHLAAHIESIPLSLPDPDTVSLAVLKTFEDGIDALICAWTGMEYLRGAATAYGDGEAAIWVPTSPTTHEPGPRPVKFISPDGQAAVFPDYSPHQSSGCVKE